MSKVFPYLLVVAMGIVLCLVLRNGCGKDSAIQKIQDSLNVEKAINDTIKIALSTSHKVFDSTSHKNTSDSIRYTRKIDSQSHIIAVLQGKFKVTKDSLWNSYNQLKVFYLNHDTVALAQTYENLSSQLTEANNELFAIQIARDSADNIREAEITRLRGVVVDLQGQVVQLQDLLKQSTDNSSSLAKTAQKAIKKQKINALLAKVGTGIAVILGVILIAHH